MNPRQFTDTCLASSQKLQGEAKPRPFTETCSVCSLKLQGRGEADAFLSTFWEAIGTTGSKQKHSKSQLVFIDPCLVSVFENSLIFNALPVPMLRQVLFLSLVSCFFEVVFQHLFEVVFVASWTVFGAHVGPMLGAFWSFFRS